MTKLNFHIGVCCKMV